MVVSPLGAYGFTIAVSVISIMIAISGISLGLGYAFNDKKLKEFGKDELYQSIVNGVLVGGLIVLFSSAGVVSSLINSVTLSNGTTLRCSSYLVQNTAICLSYDYLVGPEGYTFMGVQHSSILSTSGTMLASLFGLDAVLGVIGAFKVNLVIVSLSFNYLVTPVINEIQYLIKILSTIAIASVVQASILIFVSIGAITLILPIGLILRSFYPTRKLGGFFIALSIGLYVVLPLSYVFNIMLINSYSSAANEQNVTQMTLTGSGIENNLLALGSAQNVTAASGISTTLSNLASSFLSSISTLINQVISWLSYFIVYTFVLPAFSLIATGISVRELAELLGSEASFGRFDLLM